MEEYESERKVAKTFPGQKFKVLSPRIGWVTREVGLLVLHLYWSKWSFREPREDLRTTGNTLRFVNLLPGKI